MAAMDANDNRGSVYRLSQTRTSATVLIALEGGKDGIDKDTLDVRATIENISARRRLKPLPEVPSSPLVERETYPSTAGSSQIGHAENLILGTWYASIKIDTLHWTLEPLTQSSAPLAIFPSDATLEPQDNTLQTSNEEGAGRRRMTRQTSSSDEGGGSSEGGSSFAMIASDAGSEEEQSMALYGSGATSWQRKWTGGWTVPSSGRPDHSKSNKEQEHISDQSPGQYATKSNKLTLFSLTFEKETPAIWPRLIEGPSHEQNGSDQNALDGSSWAAIGIHYLDDEQNAMEALQPLLFASLPPYRHLLAQSRLLCDCLEIGAGEISSESLTHQIRSIALQTVHGMHSQSQSNDLTINSLLSLIALDLAAAYDSSPQILPIPPQTARTHDPDRFKRKLLTRVKTLMESRDIDVAHLKIDARSIHFSEALLTGLKHDFEPLAWSENDMITSRAVDAGMVEDLDPLAGSALLAASNDSSQDPLLETVSEREKGQMIRRRRRKRRLQEKERDELRRKLMGKGDDANRHSRFLMVTGGLVVIFIGLAILRRRKK